MHLGHVIGAKLYVTFCNLHSSKLKGLILQAKRLVDKQSRGVSIVGRRSHESDREKSLISDAALTLSLHGGNISLAREFGLAAASCRVDLDMLHQRQLPTPAVALSFDGVIANNFHFLDQRYPKQPDASRWALAFISRSCIFICLGFMFVPQSSKDPKVVSTCKVTWYRP